MGVFSQVNTYAQKKNKGKNYIAFEVAEQFSTAICFVTLCFFKAYETESKQGITLGKPPLHLLSVMQVSTLTGFAENELIEWGRTFSGFYGSENSVSGM